MAEDERSQLQETFQALQAIPISKWISFILVIAMVVGGFAALIIWANKPDYQVLFSNLDTTDASLISDRLREKKIPFQLQDGGRAILVPNENVYELRLELAGEGMPKGRNVGFEIFDEMTFGTTEFIQKMRYQQALQGELARTIVQFNAVKEARVHIVTTKEPLFVKAEESSTASVVLRLQQGRALGQNQLQGIINLVACAVEGLSPENVTVVDMDGGLLSKRQGSESLGSLSENQFDYRKKLEQSIENRVRTMLEPVVGSNKVVARISADVDFKRVSISEEAYDPDSAVVRSEQSQKETAIGGRGLPSGSPDLKFDVYETEGQSTPIGKSIEKQNLVTNYEINRTNRQIVSSVGDIKRLSAAVIIDGPYTVETDAEGKSIQKFSPRSRREMKGFEDIVKKAIGFDESRGDQVIVSNISFAMEEGIGIMAESRPQWMDYMKRAGKPLFNVLLVGLFFFFAIRPFRKWLNQTREYLAPQALPAGAEIPELGAPGGIAEESTINRDEILDLTRTDPEKIVEVIRRWMKEGS